MLQKYRFKALVFPLLHVSINFWIRTATGALLCLKFSLLKKIRVPSRGDKLKEKKKSVIIKKKCWSSPFTVVLWDHNLKKQRLLLLFLKQKHCSIPHTCRRAEKGLRGAVLSELSAWKGRTNCLKVDFASPPLPFSMCSLGKGLFPDGVNPTGGYHWKIIGKDILEMECRQ